MFDNIAFDDLSCYNLGKISDYQNGTIERTLKVISGMGVDYGRDRQWYRRRVSEAKYGWNIKLYSRHWGCCFYGIFW